MICEHIIRTHCVLQCVLPEETSERLWVRGIFKPCPGGAEGQSWPDPVRMRPEDPIRSGRAAPARFFSMTAPNEPPFQIIFRQMCSAMTNEINVSIRVLSLARRAPTAVSRPVSRPPISTRYHPLLFSSWPGRDTGVIDLARLVGLTHGRSSRLEKLSEPAVGRAGSAPIVHGAGSIGDRAGSRIASWLDAPS